VCATLHWFVGDEACACNSSQWMGWVVSGLVDLYVNLTSRIWNKRGTGQPAPRVCASDPARSSCVCE
jgi:hypothetical protein